MLVPMSYQEDLRMLRCPCRLPSTIKGPESSKSVSSERKMDSQEAQSFLIRPLKHEKNTKSDGTEPQTLISPYIFRPI